MIANSGDIEFHSVARGGALSVEAEPDDEEVAAAVALLGLEHIRYPFEHISHAGQRGGGDELLGAAGAQRPDVQLDGADARDRRARSRARPR